MIFESQYRKKALDTWERENEEAKQELRSLIEENKQKLELVKSTSIFSLIKGKFARS